MTEPVRTCVACRTRRSQRALVRLRRRSDGVIVPAMGRSAYGRSAYLCPRFDCFDKAVRRGALARAFNRGQKRAHKPARMHANNAAGNPAGDTASKGRGSGRVRPVLLDGLWPQVQAAVDSQILTLQRTGDISRSPRYDALESMRRGLREPGRPA